MTQKIMNCGILFELTGSVGYHMCMEPVDHEGPHRCGHGNAIKGTALYTSDTLAQGQGHRRAGSYGDKHNPMPSDKEMAEYLPVDEE